MWEKKVELREATHMVFTDFGPDPCIVGFANLEDAQTYIDEIKSEGGYSGTFDHYIVEPVKRVTIDHGETLDD